MKSIVVYTSRHGNTEHIAYAIAAGLRRAGEVHVFGTDDAPAHVAYSVDLMVFGGPTEAHRVTAPMSDYVNSLESVGGVAVAAFDTRLRMARWLAGSAAVGIARRLRARGARVVADPISFFVAGKVPKLEVGELERAEAWGLSLVERLSPTDQTGKVPAAPISTRP